MLTLQRKAVAKAHLDAEEQSSFETIVQDNKASFASVQAMAWPQVVINHPKIAIMWYYLELVWAWFASLSDSFAIESSDEDVVIDGENFTLSAPAMTVAQLIATLTSDDGSPQTYSVSDSDEVLKAGSANLVSGDRLSVTAQSGMGTAYYTITVTVEG
jgi:hypothetical protein